MVDIVFQEAATKASRRLARLPEVAREPSKTRKWKKTGRSAAAATALPAIRSTET